MHDLKRYCGADKPEVTRRCVASLIDTMNHAKATVPDLDIELMVFDDHSDEESVKNLKANLSRATFKADLEFLETRGIMPSILRCYEHGRYHGQEWVYFAQDDYLYDETAIHKMLEGSVKFSQNMGRPVSIYPFNDPYKYEPVNVMVRSHLVRTSDRHWRTQIMTASCFMTHISIIHNEWHLFEKMGKSEVSGVMEDESINQLFRSRGYYLFVPIPSLALHMQYSTELDTLMDWREWWDKYDNGVVFEVDATQSNLLHIGPGNSRVPNAHMADDLVGYKEITLDIDKKSNPDIIGSMTDLSAVPSNSMDVIYTSHALEHIDSCDVPGVLKSFQRILKEDGFARIIVPNMKIPAQKIAEGKPEAVLYVSSAGPITALDMFYGHRLTIKMGSDAMRHRNGFTKESLENLFKDLNIVGTVEEKEFDLLATVKKTVKEKAEA
jgi:hypothetical protein